MRKKESSWKTSASGNPATRPDTRHRNEPHEVTSDWLRIAEGAAKAGFYDWDIRTDHITWSEGIYHLFRASSRRETILCDMAGYNAPRRH